MSVCSRAYTREGVYVYFQGGLAQAQGRIRGSHCGLSMLQPGSSKHASFGKSCNGAMILYGPSRGGGSDASGALKVTLGMIRLLFATGIGRCHQSYYIMYHVSYFTAQ